jgi:hypothetical protein
MRKHITWVLALGVMLTSTAAFAQATPAPAQTAPQAGPAQRLHIPQRIRQGVRAGQLTRPEVQRLRQRLAEIRKLSQAMRGDGAFSAAERQTLRRGWRRTSRALFLMRHNKLN